ncbi:formin-I-like [Ambystoma mexicanum]|uniref:formin-I-like n=1 Tax=Ambystoma mexicanum TaxID=8296 RepID=UPI0037E910EE
MECAEGHRHHLLLRRGAPYNVLLGGLESQRQRPGSFQRSQRVSASAERTAPPYRNRRQTQEDKLYTFPKSLKWKTVSNRQRGMMQIQEVDDSIPGTLHNFTIYKFRYRWQKRILQIDFISKIIFNIEKGTLKKQFPFSQVKSLQDHDGVRFTIMFHGHQDYELEASSQEDKKHMMQLLKIIIHGNENPRPEKSCPAKPCIRKASQTDVLHEGLLELQQCGPNWEKWVKYLAKLREEELVLYFLGHKEEKVKSVPAEEVIQLTNGIVSNTSHNGLPSFTLQAKGKSYAFRISVPDHTKVHVDKPKLRDDWVDVLSNFCTHLQSQPQEQIVYSFITEVKSNNATYQETTDLAVPGKKNTMDDPADNIYATISRHPVLFPTDLSKPPTPLSRGVFPGGLPCPPPPPSSSLSPSSKRTKALHWDQVPQEKINKSIWAVSKLGPKKVDTLRILDQFSVPGRTTSIDNPFDSLSSQKILLDHKIAHNFNIVLRSFHIEPSQLKDKLLIIYEHDGGLSNEQITALRRYVPTLNDIKMYQSLTGSPSELHIVDQFMFEMCNIPNLSRRLDLLLIIRELPLCMKDLYPLISQITKACQQLLASQSFVAVLGYILAIGNYLNENAGKEKANGFRLSSLEKLSQLWGKERKFTLIHALVEQILLHEPDLTTFPLELTEFEACPGASIKGLSAEVDVLGKQLENLIEYSKFLKSKTPAQEEPFYKQLKDIIRKYEEGHGQLSKRCEEMKKLYADVLIRFGEPQDQDSQELFGWIASFVNGFKKAYSEF